MKRLFLFCAIPTVLALAGCPVDQPYPPGHPGTEKIDKQLIGTWEQSDGEKEMLKIRISAKDQTSMRVEVLEITDNYIPEERSFTAWNTSIDEMHFIYAAPENVDTVSYYTYAYAIRDGKLLTYDASFLVNGSDSITSIEAFRKELKGSMHMEGFLSDETIWTRSE
ncbi:MAG: hypothetical protein R2794_11215 [Chitinophagales bacterium]